VWKWTRCKFPLGIGWDVGGLLLLTFTKFWIGVVQGRGWRWTDWMLSNRLVHCASQWIMVSVVGIMRCI
jgi:hypothetical protein